MLNQNIARFWRVCLLMCIWGVVVVVVGGDEVWRIADMLSSIYRCRVDFAKLTSSHRTRII